MNAFEFFSVPKIVFGRGQFARAGEIAAQFGRSALVVYGIGQSGDGGPADQLERQLRAAGVRSSLHRQRGEPQVADVDRALEIARNAACDMVIALGGGSAIDCAKAAAGLLTNGGSALDYMEVIGKGKKITRAGEPFMAIPTTAGTGAEVTRNAVIGSAENHFKASIRSEHLLARVALVDPDLTLSLRPEITASAGMDALCQLIESYTSTGANAMTDALARQGIALAARSLVGAYADGADINAREDMALAALLSGITLANAGLGAAHGFAAPLGANYPLPHGTACAALLPPVIWANVEALRAQNAAYPALTKYAEIGRTAAGRNDLDDVGAIDALVQFTSDLLARLKIPPLQRFGLTENDIPQMTALARKSSSMRYNPVVLSDEALSMILRKAIRGAVNPPCAAEA